MLVLVATSRTVLMKPARLRGRRHLLDRPTTTSKQTTTRSQHYRRHRRFLFLIPWVPKTSSIITNLVHRSNETICCCQNRRSKTQLSLQKIQDPQSIQDPAEAEQHLKHVSQKPSLDQEINSLVAIIAYIPFRRAIHSLNSTVYHRKKHTSYSNHTIIN
jgi:hypothetical protein